MNKWLSIPLLISVIGCSSQVEQEKSQAISIRVQNDEGEEINVIESSVNVKKLYLRDLKIKISEKLNSFNKQKEYLIAEKSYSLSKLNKAREKVKITCDEEFIKTLGESNCNRNKGLVSENQFYVNNSESALEPTISAINDLKKLQKNLEVYEESFGLVHQKEITYEPIFKNIRVRDPIDECDISYKNNWSIPNDCMVERNKKIVNCFNPLLDKDLKRVWKDNIWELNSPPDVIKNINDKLYKEICNKYGF